jgi:hypothetical protein
LELDFPYLTFVLRKCYKKVFFFNVLIQADLYAYRSESENSNKYRLNFSNIYSDGKVCLGCTCPIKLDKAIDLFWHTKFDCIDEKIKFFDYNNKVTLGPKLILY